MIGGRGLVSLIGTPARSRHSSLALMHVPIELVFLSCYSGKGPTNQKSNLWFRSFLDVGLINSM